MSEFGMRHSNSYNAMPAGGATSEWYGGAPGASQPMQHSQSYSAMPAAGGQQWYSAGPGAYNNPQYAYSAPPQAHGSFGNSFEDEAPLLEELGIDIGSILQKTKAIVLHQMKSPCLEELDMGGALLFLFLLSGLHLLMGKVHFGIVLGWSVLQSMVLYFVVNQVASNESADARSLDLYSCCCITGYGMVPVILYSVAALLMPRGAVVGVLAVLAAAWSAVTAARVLARVSPALSEIKTLVAYPCFLMYGAFALLTAY